MHRTSQILLSVTVLAALTGWAQAQEVACCAPISDSCQLVTEQQCLDAKGIVEGSSCDGVKCTACCAEFGGNPNACNDEFNIVLCLEANGTPVSDAHCAPDQSACIPDITAASARAPAVGQAGIVAIGLLLACGGYWRLRRRA